MLSVKEAAERIGAGQSSVRLWASQGRFPGARQQTTPFGPYWEIPEIDLKDFKNPGRGRPRKLGDEQSNRRKNARDRRFGLE